MLLGLSLFFLLASEVHARPGSSSCHIHPPGSTPQNPVNIIGPFASVADCETERQRRFPGQGRCHCQADFTPRWYPMDPLLDNTGKPSDLL